MSTTEIELAIRRLPPTEAQALLERVSDLREIPKRPTPLSDEVIKKWQGRFELPAGNSVDEYLQIVRDGDRD